MSKLISIPCPSCKGKAIITLPDGRGKFCPTCNGNGFMLKTVREPFRIILKRRWLRLKYKYIPYFICRRIAYYGTDKRKLDRFLDDILRVKDNLV